jgi:hypothetical protein
MSTFFLLSKQKLIPLFIYLGCRHIYIAHCKSGKKSCGGSPDNIKCTECEDNYYSGGYGNGCNGEDFFPTVSLEMFVTNATTLMVIGSVS